AQTVSFYVRGYDTYGYFYESFKFLVSTSTGNTLEEFTELESDQDCNWISGREWKYYQFEIPAGVKYFAISYCPEEYYGIALMVDDITFTPGDNGEPLELIGYNVYRSHTLITEQPVTETSFIDTEVPEGDNDYQVTAVYNRGESAGSNSVVLKKATGVANAAVDGVTVGTGAQCITIAAAQPATVHIYAVDGTLVSSVKVNGSAKVEVAPGMYIVSTASNTYKVVVK
ncbi:MAG: choice-of-anchor J domain-containing protein, partial [Muribaculaceae bacterium]|nr:choice-of-anchor J domain-containing protein [Muribaculaceae bacterium]